MSLNNELALWQPSSSSRIPFRVYTDAQRHQQELNKIFYDVHWCYVSLKLEMSNTGNYKLSHVDDKYFDDWPMFFTKDGRYEVQARENFDRSLPLALIAAERQGMVKDRVYGITQSNCYSPHPALVTAHCSGPRI